MPVADPAPKDTEARLVAAARRLLAEAGAAGLSMRAVAVAAGVTPGAIYRHFESREALIERVVHEAAERLQAEIWQALARFPVGSDQRIVALGNMYIDFARTNPADYGVLFGPAPAGRKRRFDDAPFGIAVSALEQCVADSIAAGVFAPGDPKLIALYLWSRVHGLISLDMAFDLAAHFPQYDPATGLGALYEATRPFVLDGLEPRLQDKEQAE